MILKDNMMVLKTEWTQLETIELKSESFKSQQLNSTIDNNQPDKLVQNNLVSGFGFGITGNKSTGVVVKAITIGGSAHKDGRLRINDQIFQIGDINVRSMSSEQVAAVLRQSAIQGQTVKFIVARPVQNISPDIEMSEKKNENENQLCEFQDHSGLNTNLINLNNLNINMQCFFIPTNEIMDKNINLKQRLALEMEKRKNLIESNLKNQEKDKINMNCEDIYNNNENKLIKTNSDSKIQSISNSLLFCFISLTKNKQTIISNQNTILNNDQFIIDSIKNIYSFQISIEYIMSDCFFIILNEQDEKTKDLLFEQYDQIVEIESIQCESLLSFDRNILANIFTRDTIRLKITQNFEIKKFKLIEKWKNIIKYENEIIVSQIDKRLSKGLGISLEGTVDIDSFGNETCCHHYIRSIMANGTVDNSLQMKFKPGDELLQIDSFRLYAINYLDLLNILKNLNSKLLTLVCARGIKTNEIEELNKSEDKNDSGKDALVSEKNSDKCILKEKKRKNDINSPRLIRSRSLEINNLAMWSKHVHYISLVKGANGLGFSLIDYQKDPIIKPFSQSIVVIRALVPNGVSQLDGRLVPGQRLVSINDFDLTADSRSDLLKTVVEYLKSLPVGEPIKLGIQKPLPFPIINGENRMCKTTNSINNIVTSANSEPLPRKRKAKTTKKITTSHYDLIEKDDYKTDEKETEDSESSLEVRKKVKHNEYCLAATSAPAILYPQEKIIEQSEENKIYNYNDTNKKPHNFYSLSSLLKIQKEDLINKIESRKNSNKKVINSASEFKMLITNDDDLLFDESVNIFQMNPTLALEENMDEFEQFNSILNNSNQLIISNIEKKKASESDQIESILLLNYLMNADNQTKKVPEIENKNGQKKNDQTTETENGEKENQHLINEDQFNRAFINNASKRLNHINSTTYECKYETTIDQLHVNLKDKSHLKHQLSSEIREINSQVNILQETSTSKNNSAIFDIKSTDSINLTSNNKENNFKEMVKEMASFNWSMNSRVSTNTLDDHKELQESETNENILNSGGLITKKIKFIDLPLNDLKQSTDENQLSKKCYRSTSTSRLPCSGGLITTPDNLRRRKRYLKVRKKFSSAYTSRDISTSNIHKPENATKNLKNNFNIRSRSSSFKIINILGKEIIKLPTFLEKEIKIKKSFDPLGITLVDCYVDEGVNGCIILKIEKSSACYKDSRLNVGDYLLSVNNEQMRNLTNSSARAILNRATLTSSELISIIYIPAKDALNYVNKFNKYYSTEFKLKNAAMDKRKARKDIFQDSNLTERLSSSTSLSYASNKSSQSSRPSSSETSVSFISKSNSLINSSESLISLDSFNKLESSSLSHSLSIDNTKTDITNKKRNKILTRSKNNATQFSNDTKLTNKKENDQKCSISSNKKENLKKKTSESQNSNKQVKSLTDNSYKEKSVTNNSSIKNLPVDATNINESLKNSLESDGNPKKIILNSHEINNSLWSPPKTVIVERCNNASLGISIIGGKFDVSSKFNENKLQQVNGIFIKHVLDNSLACINGSFKIGDRIISVNEFDLTNETHENAVKIIKNAVSPVKFVIQSIISETQINEEEESRKLSETKYECSLKKLKEKYSFLLTSKENQLFSFKLMRSNINDSLGLGLSGNIDTNKTSVFVCAIYKDSIAEKHGLIKVGDQILEINGNCVLGKAHSNVTPLIKSIKDLEINILVLRNPDNINKMFVPNSFNSDKTIKSLNKKNFEERESLKSNVKDVSSKVLDNNSSEIGAKYKIVKLSKDTTGFGIAICEDRFRRLIVRGLNPSGVASQDGRIEVGDEILAINSIKVNTLNYDEIMNTLHKTTSAVEFTLTKPENFAADESCSSKINTTKINQKISLSSNQLEKSKTAKINEKDSGTRSKQCTVNHLLDDDLSTKKIFPGEETLIEIEKSKLGLGLSIVGGIDTQLPGIIIHDIHPNGAAFLDKRLAIGDQILKVNDFDLTNVTHEEALNALRQTADNVKLLVHRGFLCNTSSITISKDKDNYNNNYSGIWKYLEANSNTEDEKIFNILSIDLNKKFGKGLGFSIIGRSNLSTETSGVFISHIIEGSCAHKDGRLMIGDLILEVNNKDIRGSSYNNVAFLLKTLPPGKVNLKIGRLKLSTIAICQNSSNVSKQATRRGSSRI